VNDGPQPRPEFQSASNTHVSIRLVASISQLRIRLTSLNESRPTALTILGAGRCVLPHDPAAYAVRTSGGPWQDDHHNARKLDGSDSLTGAKGPSYAAFSPR